MLSKLFSIGKDRRKQTFYPIIRAAYTRPGENYVTNKVYYEAAEQFAKENSVGVTSPGGDSISADVMLGDERVAVWFGKGLSGELIVSVENAEAQMKRVLGDRFA